MNPLSSHALTATDRKQGRLFQWAALFLFLSSLALTLAPAARHHSWDAPYYRWGHWIGFGAWIAGFYMLHHQTSRRLPYRDPYLLPAAALLCGWGLLTIWRLDVTVGLRQSLWLVVSLLVFSLGLHTRDLMNLLRRYQALWLTTGLLITALTFILGTYPEGEGPRLWLGCCGVYFQPSEPLKLLLVVYLAAYFSTHPFSKGFQFLTILTPTLTLLGIALLMLVFQRDLGTASLFIALYTAVVFIASNRRWVLAISGLLLVSAAATGYLMFDIIRLRIDAWLNPWLDSMGRSYQIVQSILAIASGGLIGRGPGMGSPSLVPISHSDFIFTAIAEEWGAAGAMALLLLIGLIVQRGFRAGWHAPNLYLRLLASGLSAYLGIQSLLIIGGNLRALPLTGVTLPFVSYGGSSLLTTFLALLILLRISNEGLTHPPGTDPPIQLLSTLILIALGGLAILSGWWGIVTRDQLLARPENPRPAISDLYSRRGSLLDINGQELASSQGTPGEYLRVVHYPPLAATLGYSQIFYGQAGLEAGLNQTLRGLTGSDPISIKWYEMVFGQSPPGQDIRLTIDLRVQQHADTLLEGEKGALVVLNPTDGSLQALVSHPYFDPNQMEAEFDNWLSDKNAPLLNRATQGQYPPAAALGPFLISAVGAGRLPALPDPLSVVVEGQQWDCSLPPADLTWVSAIRAGCPAATLTLANTLPSGGFTEMYRAFGFEQVIDLPLPVAQTPALGPDLNTQATILGQDQITVSPLQMALAAARFTTGKPIQPRLVDAENDPTLGWVPWPAEKTQSGAAIPFDPEVLQQLKAGDFEAWESLGSSQSDNEGITWYLAGSLPDWENEPAVLVIALENSTPQTAQTIGRQMLSFLSNK